MYFLHTEQNNTCGNRCFCSRPILDKNIISHQQPSCVYLYILRHMCRRLRHLHVRYKNVISRQFTDLSAILLGSWPRYSNKCEHVWSIIQRVVPRSQIGGVIRQRLLITATSAIPDRARLHIWPSYADASHAIYNSYAYSPRDA